MEREKPQQQRHKAAAGRKMLFILLGLAVCLIAFLVALYPMVSVTAGRSADIRIPADATAENVRDSLDRYLGPEFARNVMRLARLRHTDFSRRHGSYAVTEGMNVLDATRRLTSGAQTPVRITINGFRSLPLLIERISAKMEFPADSLRSALADSALMAEYGLTTEQALSLFVDDSYEAYWTLSARDLVRKIGENYRRLWDTDRTRAAASLGLTPADVMTIASITDEETNSRGEKGTIGRLYINRLHHGMKLQADPTVRFAVGDFTIRRVSRADLRTPSPYNTYLNAGLPPGPIRTTSAETVTTILESKPNNYLYMCASEDFSGTHNFASTYEEHLQNARRYQAELDRRGIKR